MCRITSSNSGCIKGSPPLIVIIDVPISASRSSRRFISSIGTGFDTWSYSLQYPQSRLQRRIGIMCTNTGCLVESSALPIIFSSRARVRKNRNLRCVFTLTLAFIAFFPVPIFGLDPVRLLLNYTFFSSLSSSGARLLFASSLRCKSPCVARRVFVSISQFRVPFLLRLPNESPDQSPRESWLLHGVRFLCIRFRVCRSGKTQRQQRRNSDPAT